MFCLLLGNAEKVIVFEGDEAIMLYSMDFPVQRIGNFLGFFFESLMCAHLSGIHFVVINKALRGFSTKSNNRKSSPQVFMDAFPHYLLHQKPTKGTTAARNAYDKHCSCPQYCFEELRSAWYHDIPRLQGLLSTALKNYYENEIAKKAITFRAKDFAPTTRQIKSSESNEGHRELLKKSKGKEVFPLIPDVTIHLRCSDVIRTHLKGKYGFLNFHAYSHTIPQDKAKLIYVVTEKDFQSDARVCDIILAEMVDFLETQFPSSTVLVRRGGNPLHTMLQFAYSPITICSASTFCFWPAMVATGHAFYPVSNLILESKEIFVSNHFHWITSPPILWISNSYSNQTIVEMLTSTRLIYGPQGPAREI